MVKTVRPILPMDYLIYLFVFSQSLTMVQTRNAKRKRATEANYVDVSVFYS